jgi:hypothetical protein
VATDKKPLATMRIFVQLASYRDRQLIPTIEDMLRKARRPDLLTVGICRQYHPEDGFDNLQRYKRDPRFRIREVPYTQSRGACWARNLVQGLYRGEEFTLQIDSHMRFAAQWDQMLLGMIRPLIANGVPKPMLTGYVPAFEPDKVDLINQNEPPLQMICNSFSPEGAVCLTSEPIEGWQKLKYPVHGRFFAGGFCFTLGRFCHEVRYDPELYFLGEEISMSVRAYTHGYDLFHPHRTVLWHYYIRRAMPRHWDDHADWQRRDSASYNRMRKLLGVGNERPAREWGRYGLGPVRTLKEYERYAGISFAKKTALR